jgi:hypothetical protein
MKISTTITVVFAALSIAVGVAAEGAETALPPEAEITESDRDHWAFQPVRRPNVPSVQNADWVRNDIDAFILVRLELKQIAPAREADRATLLRRLSFDLTGLPPTPEELAAFLADESPDAYERQVDRLLASPAYGERWAQHWLDLARFAETDGFEHDKLRGDAWRYRDWVIAALNADMPYDRFVAEQLAGDLLQPGDPQAAIPTTFCLAGPDMPDINDQQERRHEMLNELTATVGSALLGLQLGCAQCHDHKYDPLSQADFYRLRAVFEPAVGTLKRDVPFNTLQQQEQPVAARLWIRGDHRRPGPEVLPGFLRIASPEGFPGPSDGRPARLQLVEWLFADDHPLTARVIANRLWQHHFGRGLVETSSDFGLMGSSSHESLLDFLATKLRDRAWSLKELHRLIVCSATYRQASRSMGDDTEWTERLTKDPSNKLYSRYPRRRLDGESLRDAMLVAAGTLNREAGGPGVMPPLPEPLLETLLKGQWTADRREANHYRRSAYVFARRNLRYPIFEAFDRPDGNASCPVRGRSTTAPQSLLLLNGELSLAAARRFAGRIAAESADPEAQAVRMYVIAFSRPATEVETGRLVEFLQRQTERLKEERRNTDDLVRPIPPSASLDPYRAAALVDACLAIFNSNEFVYVD